MKSNKKNRTLEAMLPLMAVEQGCIISKDAEITVAYEVVLPELFTITREEYEAMHSMWGKAIGVLPSYTVVHKQDWFVEDQFQPDLEAERSF